jgi:uncharacterized protein YcsI (UPF0317 family)
LRGDALGKTCMALLAVVSALAAVARAETSLAWDAPSNSPVSVDGYRIYRDGVLVAEPSAASLSWPIDVSDGERHTFGISSIHRDIPTNVISESRAATVSYTPSPSQVSDSVVADSVVSDSVPPSVAVSIYRIRGSSNYQATATATDTLGVERIELSLDTSLFATCYTSPCSAPLSIKSRGSHVVVAVAWDAAGNKAASAYTVQR